MEEGRKGREGGEKEVKNRPSVCSALWRFTAFIYLLRCSKEAGRIEEREEEKERGGLHVFLPGSATLSPGRWGGRGGEREKEEGGEADR